MVETSTFGAEFVALKIVTELIKSLRYTLHMMGVPLEGPVKVLADNNSVVKNSMVPTSLSQKNIIQFAIILSEKLLQQNVSGLLLYHHLKILQTC
jgi:hypothetical protein